MTQEIRSTSVPCKWCGRMCGGPAGLASHIRSMHPEHITPLGVPRVPPPAGAPAPASNGTGAADDGIVWEDPPAGRRTSALIEEVRLLVPTLKRNPGRFARLRIYDSRTGAGSGISGLRRAFPDITFVGKHYGNGSAIWARYVEPDG